MSEGQTQKVDYQVDNGVDLNEVNASAPTMEGSPENPEETDSIAPQQPDEKRDIRLMTKHEIAQAVADLRQPSFRAKQLDQFLWKHGAHRFEEMVGLPKPFMAALDENYQIRHASIADYQRSRDKTIKNAFRLYDGSVVEGVLIPTSTRMTACVSSQVGCSLSCKFCATGRMARLRNIEAPEIYDQVLLMARQAEREYGIPLSHIVYMGMGEPLLNYREVMHSIEKITSPEGLGMSPRRITVSTAGIAKQIKKLGDDGAKFHLALSLHAANDRKRSEIMPINDSNKLSALSEALVYFHDKTGTRISYEYIIFEGFNDTIQDAAELAQFARHTPCKINLLQYNSIGDSEWRRASNERIDDFANYLMDKNLVVNIRRSRGQDIDAACGQLANKNQAAQEV